MELGEEEYPLAEDHAEEGGEEESPRQFDEAEDCPFATQPRNEAYYDESVAFHKAQFPDSVDERSAGHKAFFGDDDFMVESSQEGGGPPEDMSPAMRRGASKVEHGSADKAPAPSGLAQPVQTDGTSSSSMGKRQSQFLRGVQTRLQPTPGEKGAKKIKKKALKGTPAKPLQQPSPTLEAASAEPSEAPVNEASKQLPQEAPATAEAAALPPTAAAKSPGPAPADSGTPPSHSPPAHADPSSLDERTQSQPLPNSDDCPAQGSKRDEDKHDVDNKKGKDQQDEKDDEQEDEEEEEDDKVQDAPEREPDADEGQGDEPEQKPDIGAKRGKPRGDLPKGVVKRGKKRYGGLQKGAKWARNAKHGNITVSSSDDEHRAYRMRFKRAFETAEKNGYVTEEQKSLFHGGRAKRGSLFLKYLKADFDWKAITMEEEREETTETKDKDEYGMKTKKEIIEMHGETNGMGIINRILKRAAEAFEDGTLECHPDDPDNEDLYLFRVLVKAGSTAERTKRHTQKMRGTGDATPEAAGQFCAQFGDIGPGPVLAYGGAKPAARSGIGIPRSPGTVARLAASLKEHAKKAAAAAASSAGTQEQEPGKRGKRGSRNKEVAGGGPDKLPKPKAKGKAKGKVKKVLPKGPRERAIIVLEQVNRDASAAGGYLLKLKNDEYAGIIVKALEKEKKYFDEAYLRS